MTAATADAEIERRVWRLLEQVQDPEIPVLSVVDLGIARDVRVRDGEVEVVITPTYSGCPAMDTIARDIADALAAEGLGGTRVTTQLAPAWTTDWLSDKLPEEAIAMMRSPGCLNTCSLRKVEMLSRPALVRVSAIMTSPSRTRIPQQ